MACESSFDACEESLRRFVPGPCAEVRVEVRVCEEERCDMDGNRFDELTRAMHSGTTRRRALGLLSGGLVALISGRNAKADPAAKVGICHVTESASNPYRYISVSGNAVAAHAAHGDAVNIDLQADVNNCGSCGNVCGGDACNTPTCLEGVCASEPVMCDDGNVCTDDSCDPEFGCQHVNNSASCTTEAGAEGTCDAGSCVPDISFDICESSASICELVQACGPTGICACHATPADVRGCVEVMSSCDAYSTCGSTAECGDGYVCALSCCPGGRCVPECGTVAFASRTNSNADDTGESPYSS